MANDLVRRLQLLELSKMEASVLCLKEATISSGYGDCKKRLLGKVFGDKVVNFQGY